MRANTLLLFALILAGIGFAYMACVPPWWPQDPGCTIWSPGNPYMEEVCAPWDISCKYLLCSDACYYELGLPWGCLECPDEFMRQNYGPACIPGYGYVTNGAGYGYYCDSDNDDRKSSLRVELEPSCEGNVVTVENEKGSPVKGAHVTVKDTADAELIASGDTDSDGKFTFQGCGMKAEAKATKSGYRSDYDVEDLEACSECGGQEPQEPGCTSDSQCLSTERCASGECVQVPCECGKVENHQCVEYDCCSDADCDVGEQCASNACVERPPECTSDDQCSDTQYCDIPAGQAGGSCQDVQGGDCGQVISHAFVAYGYECGPEEGCPQCQEGYACVEHKCVQNDLSCPTTGLVGDEKTCSATEEGKPCANCDYEVTAPDGSKSSGQTDENGNFDLPLDEEGTYKVALLKDGKVLKVIEVKAFPQAQPEEPEAPAAAGPDLLSFVWLLVLLLLVILGIVYWRSRASKKA